MFSSLIKLFFGTKNNRELKRMGRLVAQINQLEADLMLLTDMQLRDKTADFKQRYQQGETLEQLLPEAFAVVREASRRALSMRHFDVQLLGGITLHEGRIAEMRTGEGKTLVATLPAYLNALTGLGVHIVTVNDYLAQRDALWMTPVYEFLGLSVGIVLSQQPSSEKRIAYAADIVYATNNELGFDYLRDNMALSLEDKAQRSLNYAIVDEVDSILIDEARTPLIISGPSEDAIDLYEKINVLVPKLNPRPLDAPEDSTEGHYVIDEKNRQIELTELGHEYVEELFVQRELLQAGESLYSAANLNLLHHLHAALKAHNLFQKDVQYIVQNNQIVIVDEHTGRTMPGRRWSDGIHQAIEAKEGVNIQQENQTLASTTFQNYFRQYTKLSGMTGTADTEAYEFHQIYGLDVVVMPTNKPMVRNDEDDVIYLSAAEKYQAIVEDIKTCIEKKVPVLVGTASIETSEYLSQLLKKSNISHKVLNAKYHAQEAEIIAQAGKPGAVTIATNMAGRGTDIILGGNWQAEIAQLKEPNEEAIARIKAAWQQRHEQVLAAGGLHIIGTERHESRRIDNQLRGRAGRQGDQGASRFYLSLEDDLLRIFASDRMRNLMKGLGMQPGEAITHPWVTRSIENAQKKVEGRNFDMRKSLLEYDDVANDQRQVIYHQRNQILAATDIAEAIEHFREQVVNQAIDQYVLPQTLLTECDIAGLERTLETEFRIQLPLTEWIKSDATLHETAFRQKILDAFVTAYAEKTAWVEAPEVMRQLEKNVMLQTLDRLWKEHLASMDYLRQGIHLRGYAARNPKQEYKREAFALFQNLLSSVQYEVIRILSVLEIHRPEEVEQMAQQRREAAERQPKHYEHASVSALYATEEKNEGEASDPTEQPYQREQPKVGRNDPCPCGSEKKYKHCHGVL